MKRETQSFSRIVMINWTQADGIEEQEHVICRKNRRDHATLECVFAIALRCRSQTLMASEFFARSMYISISMLRLLQDCS